MRRLRPWEVQTILAARGRDEPEGAPLPAWVSLPEGAARLHCSLFALEWALEYGGFSQQYAWYCEWWALQAQHAATRQRRAQRDSRYRGWRGGETDPTLSCTFKDEVAA